MGSGVSTVLVVGTAVVVGIALANGANAGSTEQPTSTAPDVASARPAAPGTSREDHESDEPHAVSTDNPYDESGQPRAPVTRQSVIARDGMVRLPGGRFIMGSSSSRAPANERPAHAVTVSPFWIDRTEVTVGAYRACVDGGACTRPAKTSASCTFDAGDPDMPVSCVHWRDGDAYCRFAGKRLPSESEWEYAAHGPYASPFPWGGVSSSCSNAVTLVYDLSASPCQAHPARVGTHPTGASVFGVQDMSGNVEEWTADWYVDSLGPGPAPRSGSAHVLRGGGWLSTPTMSRTTSRNWGSALEAGANVGFRCAKTSD